MSSSGNHFNFRCYGSIPANISILKPTLVHNIGSSSNMRFFNPPGNVIITFKNIIRRYLAFPCKNTSLLFVLIFKVLQIKFIQKTTHFLFLLRMQSHRNSPKSQTKSQRSNDFHHTNNNSPASVYVSIYNADRK